MIPLDFYFKWGSMYQINSFGCPTEEIMFLGRSNGFIVCCSESGLHTDWLKRGFATQIPSAMAEYVYMLPESVFYPKNRDQYPEHIRRSSNFETVDAMISMNLLTAGHMKQSLSYLWDLNEDSHEVSAYKWFINKIMSVSDCKISEKTLNAYLRIAESILEKNHVNKTVIDLYVKYMAITGSYMVYSGEQRFKSICEFQANQLPF